MVAKGAVLVDITGMRFGSLVAVRRDGWDKSGKPVWLCTCDCGGSTHARSNVLKAGQTKACGSAAHRRRRIVTDLDRKLYGRWKAMVERTTKDYSLAWHNYGGRGIGVCERWSGDQGFENFIADMGPSFVDGLELDRIDNGRGYEPTNCRWATRTEQTRNRRSNRLVTLDGRTQTVTEWALERGLRPSQVFNRLAKGWTEERALSTPIVTDGRGRPS